MDRKVTGRRIDVDVDAGVMIPDAEALPDLLVMLLAAPPKGAEDRGVTRVNPSAT